ncbi:MAG: restriction endonuclease [Thermomicrobiales bacterium]
MTVMPTWDGFNVSVLRYLSDGAVRGLSDIRQAVADSAGLTVEQRAEQLPSGQPKADNRIGWAVSYLTRVGAIERPARARYQITTVGRDLLARHPDGISEQLLRTMAKPGDEWWVTKRSGSGTTPDIIELETKPLDPMEQIEEGLARIQSDVAADLLQRLQSNSPKFFEAAVVKLLVAMGYGGADGRATVTQQSNDGGIDGVIDRDALGLDRVYIQAKRYQSGTSVQRPEVQAFVGALSGKATTGVFLTTGAFSSGAEEYARTAHTRVILIDGRRLTELMIRYGVGVQTRQVLNVVAVDEDFFE